MRNDTRWNGKREYTITQVLKDLEAIAEGREEDVKLPVRILKREHTPELINAKKRWEYKYKKKLEEEDGSFD